MTRYDRFGIKISKKFMHNVLVDDVGRWLTAKWALENQGYIECAKWKTDQIRLESLGSALFRGPFLFPTQERCLSWQRRCWCRDSTRRPLGQLRQRFFPQIARSYRGSYFSKIGLLIPTIAKWSWCRCRLVSLICLPAWSLFWPALGCRCRLVSLHLSCHPS